MRAAWHIDKFSSASFVHTVQVNQHTNILSCRSSPMCVRACVWLLCVCVCMKFVIRQYTYTIEYFQMCLLMMLRMLHLVVDNSRLHVRRPSQLSCSDAQDMIVYHFDLIILLSVYYIYSLTSSYLQRKFTLTFLPSISYLLIYTLLCFSLAERGYTPLALLQEPQPIKSHATPRAGLTMVPMVPWHLGPSAEGTPASSSSSSIPPIS